MVKRYESGLSRSQRSANGSVSWPEPSGGTWVTVGYRCETSNAHPSLAASSRRKLA